MSKMQTSTGAGLGNSAYQYPTLGQRPATDLVQYLKDYARTKPESAALWCFGIGFVLGWKLKPW